MIIAPGQIVIVELINLQCKVGQSPVLTHLMTQTTELYNLVFVLYIAHHPTTYWQMTSKCYWKTPRRVPGNFITLTLAATKQTVGVETNKALIA